MYGIAPSHEKSIQSIENFSPRTCILTYHTIGPHRKGWDRQYHLSTEAFTRHLDAIQEEGYQATTIEALLNEETKCEGRTVILTFDDGNRCHADIVFPLLIERGLVGEFFVNTGPVGENGYADWQMLQDMHAAGMSIQSHGHFHVYMDDLDSRCLLFQLQEARAQLEIHLGINAGVFAAPGGRINRYVARVARLAGYRACCGARPALWMANDFKNIIPRITVRKSTTPELIKNWLQGDLGLMPQVRYESLKFAKKIFGNTTYTNLRRLILHCDDPPRSRAKI